MEAKPSNPPIMKSHYQLASLAVTSSIILLPLSVFAQSGTPVAEPPPAAPTPAQTAAAPDQPAEAPVSLNDASNSTGKSSGSGTVKELRFAAVDVDSDHRISLAEFSGFMDAGATPRSTVNAEGVQTGVNPVEVLFRQIDKDNDGFLSETELTTYQDEQNRANGVAR